MLSWPWLFPYHRWPRAARAMPRQAAERLARPILATSRTLGPVSLRHPRDIASAACKLCGLPQMRDAADGSSRSRDEHRLAQALNRTSWLLRGSTGKLCPPCTRGISTIDVEVLGLRSSTPRHVVCIAPSIAIILERAAVAAPLLAEHKRGGLCISYTAPKMGAA